MNKDRRITNTILVVAGVMLIAVTAVNAATFTVTKTADTDDGICDADCSLREAVSQVGGNPVPDQIVFSALFDSPQTIVLLSSIGFSYGTNVELIGSGNQNVTLTTVTGYTDGLLFVNSDWARIFNLRFANAENSLRGGAITGDDAGALIIERCLFENNRARDGGAVSVRANTSATILNSTFRNNEGLNGRGGAIFLENYQSQTVSGSTFSGNQANNGAAIYFDAYVGLDTSNTITNSTFSGNIAATGSTIFSWSGLLNLVNVTVANNSGPMEAVDANNSPYSQAKLTNSIVSQNSGGDVSSNVIQIAPNYIGGNPLLGALANNGGETETRELLAASPAIDAGTAVGAPATDQRGIARPQGAGFDLGAFEKIQTYLVTKTEDTNDGVCDADCSLREAVYAASVSSNASDIIEFSTFFDVQRWIVLNYESVPGVIDPITINKSLEIRGKGPNQTSVTGAGNEVLLFKIITPSGNPTTTAVFRDLQFAEAQGAIYNDTGNLTIENCLFIDNLLPGSKDGGAALHHHSGILTVNDSAFYFNRIPDGDSAPGGAISLYLGTATITNSTFVGNSATRGSAFYSEFGVANFVNSTIAYNSGPPSGGTSYVVTTTNGTINMTNVTATQNNVRDNGTTVGQQWNAGGIAHINIKNTVVAGNISVPSGAYPTNVMGVTSMGHNFIGFAFPNDGFPTGSPNANNDYVGDYSSPLDPMLDQLDNYGGATDTFRPLIGSSLIDHGTPVGAPALDQRGISRPQGSQFDIGSFELQQTPPLVILTGSNLPSGGINQFYSSQIVADGGSPPYSFALTAGAQPNGITVANDGLVSGTPTQFGTYSFSVTVTDGASTSVQKAFQLVIDPPPMVIVTGANLPNANQNQVYSEQILVEGGTAPYSFALTGGALPPGITLSNGGLLSGPPSEYGTFSFTVTATDSASGTAQRAFQLFVAPPPLVFLTGPNLPNANQNRSYSQQILAEGGAPPYGFSVTGGNLPVGLNLSSTGLLSGTPAGFGSFAFEITVNDSFGTLAQRTFFVTIFPPVQIISVADLPKGITNQFYTRQIWTTGGIGPYVYTLAGGALPNGFSLSLTGVVSGTATQAGTFSFVVQATDSQGIQDQKTFNLTISDLYIVTTADDTNDGVCDAHCSLREAVAVGDSVPGSSNVIEFSLFFESLQTIYLTSSILITKTTEIRGRGQFKTVISTVGTRQTKFKITGTGDVTFRNLLFGRPINGTGSGAIDNESSGQMTIDTCFFKDNEKFFSPQNPGGAAILQTAGTLTVTNSTFRSNIVFPDNSVCGGKGGAISFSGVAARIANSTFVANLAPNGTAIYGNGSTSIENSTFSGNAPRWDGCVAPAYATILNETGSVAITSSTVYRNANFDVSGSALAGNISIKNSIVAGNVRDVVGAINSPDVGAGVVSLGYNLISFAPAFVAGLPNANHDYIGTSATPLDPLLDLLAFNGGDTETHASQGISLAINNGTSLGAPVTDQRGVARPQGAGVDIGAFETDVPITSAATPAGSNVGAQLGTVSLTFANVTSPGTTTQIPIFPAVSGTLPGGFSFGTGLPAYQLTTTADYSGPIVICIQTPGVSNLQIFNNLHLFHNENGSLVDRTVSRDYPTRTICAQTTSLSPFAFAETLAPTAANVSISGRVATSSGNAIARAMVQLTDQNGSVLSAISNGFGYYRFDDIPIGNYVVSVSSKQYTFAPQMINLSESVQGLDLLPLESATPFQIPLSAEFVTRK